MESLLPKPKKRREIASKVPKRENNTELDEDEKVLVGKFIFPVFFSFLLVFDGKSRYRPLMYSTCKGELTYF